MKTSIIITEQLGSHTITFSFGNGTITTPTIEELLRILLPDINDTKQYDAMCEIPTRKDATTITCIVREVLARITKLSVQPLPVEEKQSKFPHEVKDAITALQLAYEFDAPQKATVSRTINGMFCEYVFRYRTFRRTPTQLRICGLFAPSYSPTDEAGLLTIRLTPGTLDITSNTASIAHSDSNYIHGRTTALVVKRGDVISDTTFEELKAAAALTLDTIQRYCQA